MNEEEKLKALMKEFVRLYYGAAEDAEVEAMDDLPRQELSWEVVDLSPEELECRRAHQERDWKHMGKCLWCLDSEVRSILMDAASHRIDGNEADALALEAEAADCRQLAARLRRGIAE